MLWFVSAISEVFRPYLNYYQWFNTYYELFELFDYNYVIIVSMWNESHDFNNVENQRFNLINSKQKSVFPTNEVK